VNENDLVNALKENLIKGACIDVFENEPILQNSQFTNKEIAEKLILSPHIAWASVEARNRLVSIVSNNIEQFYQGNNLNRIV
ncbi:MAG: NAD(P)-dependent oxidoreductase, partial [Clostridia bacterium]